MNITMSDVRLIRTNAWPSTSRKRTKGCNIWGIGPINPFLDYKPRPEQWEPDFDIGRLLDYAVENCVEVWNENGHVLFSTIGKTSQAALRELERKLTQQHYCLPHWCTGWKRYPTYSSRAVRYSFTFPPDMLHKDPEMQRYSWPWLQWACRGLFPQCAEIIPDLISRYSTPEGKPVGWLSLRFTSNNDGMEHFVPTPQSLALLADLLSIQLQRPIRG
jgi:hypothetical protein